jgi:S1-C subfamily serine protease
MNILDLLIVAAALAAATGGYRIGLLSRAFAWIGLGLGLVLAFRIAGPAVDLVDRQNQGGRLLMAVMVPLLLATLGQSLGYMAGDRIRRSLPPQLRPVDQASGALAGLLGVAVMIWLLTPTLGLVPGVVARIARTSAIITFLDDTAPDPPASVHELAQQVSELPFPQVFADLGVSPDAGPAPEVVALAPEVLATVQPSTMNIESRGCGGIQEGSGFVVEPELVVTNAHVVAGTTEHEIVLDDGSRLTGAVVHYDPSRDLALLSVPGLARPPLPLGEVELDETVAVFGYPGGQDSVRIAPGTVAGRRAAVGRDIYGSGEARREILILAAELRHGDSGSAVVSADGQVVGVAFAIAPDRSSTAYALTRPELAEMLAAPRQQVAPTGACI